MTQNASNPNTPNIDPEINQLRLRVRRLHTRVRLILLMRSLLLSVSVFVIATLSMIALDYALRFPVGLRLITLLGLVYVLVQCCRRWVIPSVWINISMTDIALQIEKQDPSLRGLVASVIDLETDLLSSASNDPSSADHDEEEQIHRALVQASIVKASRRVLAGTFPPIVRTNGLIKAAALFVVLGGFMLVMATQQPRLSYIGAWRVLAPWTGVSWPKRFAIVDQTQRDAHAIDLAVPIRALIGDQDSEFNARSFIAWRVLDQGGKAINQWTKATMVPQNRRESTTGYPIYEQLIDVQQIIAGHAGQSYTLEYTLSTQDDRIDIQRIPMVRPPELLATTVEITLPQYSQVLAESGLIESGVIESIGFDTYDTVVSPILAGSSVRVRWRFSKAIEFDTTTLPGWSTAFSQGNTLVGVQQTDNQTFEIELLADQSAVIEPGVLDTNGIPVRNPVVFSMGILKDQNPGATIIEPQRDEMVSANAQIQLQAQLTDDLGLSVGSIQITHARPPVDSSGAPHEPLGESGELIQQRFYEADTEPDSTATHQRASLVYELDLGTIDVEPGDQLWVQAIAQDLQGLKLGQSQDSMLLGRTESATRVLSIVEDSQLVEQIRQGLNPIRNSIRQLDDQQSTLQEQLRENQLTSSHAQRSIVDRLAANLRTMEQLGEMIRRNGLKEPALSSLLDDAAAVTQEAIEAGENASDQIDRGNRDRAMSEGREVRDRLGELMSMLDRGQDSWLALRAVEQLRDELESLRDDTADLNEQIAGKSLDQLSQAQRSMLEQILERQLAAADDAGAALTTLDERAEQLQENDPTQAQALSKAAEQGRSSQIEQKLQEAGEQIASNQTSSATQTQDEVLQELEEMLEELENSINNRDNALRRELASIIDSLKGLIAAQQIEITILDDDQRTIKLETLDDRMITLSGNTLAVRDDALGAFPETRSIADLISKAAGAQARAIESLRMDPVEIQDALRHELSSVLNLQSALEEAQRLDDQAAQRQAQRQRAQLRDAYRQVLQAQTALRDETKLLIGQRLNRRQRSHARALASAHDELRAQLAELLEQTEELSDAPVFTLAHGQLDSYMIRIRDGLTTSQVQQRLLSAQDASVILLSSLVSVLSESSNEQDPEDFEDGSQGGSGSGSGGGSDEPVIPPMAQLQLLRTMQQLVASQTREISERPESVDSTDIEAVSSFQRALFEQGRALIEQMSQQPTQNPNPDGDSAVERESPIEQGEGLNEDRTPEDQTSTNGGLDR